MMKYFSKISIIGMAFSVAILFLSASLTFAQSSRIYLEPVDSTAETLVLDVVAENVTELYGAEFKLKFDPTIFSVQDVDPDRDGVQIEAGSFLPASQGFIVVNQADDAEGSVTYALTLLNPAPPVSGTGPLARVTFNILQPDADSTIEVENAKLVSFSLQTIPSELVAFTIGEGQPAAPPTSTEEQAMTSGESAAVVADDVQADNNPVPAVENQDQAEAAAPAVIATTDTVAVPESEFPWWIVAVGIILLGFLSLGVFAVMGGAKKPQTAPPTVESRTAASNDPSQPTHVRGSRPSAFK
ncbi:MAG: hypothetical protein KDI02_17895 [Anaerolineae bacterium]|nr:hypothetical protein [Anaerolineae bacterium]MCB0225567.1 hypothetical protein [Anaerolineae bacterium]